jgi:hypothetical protein
MAATTPPIDQRTPLGAETIRVTPAK